MTTVYIGTSGYSYKDWQGKVYPPGTKSGDMLTYYSRFLPVVELNFSYYRMPKKDMLARMAARTPGEFKFIVKSHRSLTHDEPKGKREDIKAFTSSLGPLIEKGKLGGVLLQFPFSFHYRKTNLVYLDHLQKELLDLPLAIEFRNEKWLNDEVQAFLRERDLAFVCVDQPHLKGLLPPVIWQTTSWSYIRLHGRNKAKWWYHEHAWERYDYSYSQDELEQWAQKIKGLSRKVKLLFITFNNHYQGQSFRNSLDMATILRQINELEVVKIP